VLFALGVSSAAATGTPGDSRRGTPAAQAKSNPPNFNGVWVGDYGGVVFEITSGTSTSIVGRITVPAGCPGVTAYVKGMIVNGSGEITIVEEHIIGQCILLFLGENKVTNVKVSDGIATSFNFQNGDGTGIETTMTNNQKPALVNVSGTVELSCGGSCSADSPAGPLQGITMDVSGPSSATAETDDQGKWNVDVAAGDYTITPEDPYFTFTPDHIDVNVTGDLTKQDFDACGDQGSDADDPIANLASTNSTQLWNLVGSSKIYKNCKAQVDVSYNPKTNKGTVLWFAAAWLCSPTLGGNSYWATKISGARVSGPIALDGTDLTGTPTPGGGVELTAYFSGTPAGTWNINPGGQSGTVKTIPAAIPVQVDAEDGETYNCLPARVKGDLIPGVFVIKQR
jgi:hypothetical protein